MPCEGGGLVGAKTQKRAAEAQFWPMKLREPPFWVEGPGWGCGCATEGGGGGYWAGMQGG